MILCEFVKIPQSFFSKNDSSLYKGAFDGGSKPPPYNVVVCFVSFATAFGCLSLTMQLLLFRKNHARLACSVVNALATARCRYQLLRISDNRKGCPYGMIFHSISYNKNRSFGSASLRFVHFIYLLLLLLCLII